MQFVRIRLFVLHQKVEFSAADIAADLGHGKVMVIGIERLIERETERTLKDIAFKVQNVQLIQPVLFGISGDIDFMVGDFEEIKSGIIVPEFDVRLVQKPAVFLFKELKIRPLEITGDLKLVIRLGDFIKRTALIVEDRNMETPASIGHEDFVVGNGKIDAFGNGLIKGLRLGL
jgi:hypothetical protein